MIFEHNKIPFTSLDLCCIIEAAQKLGVKRFRYGDLEFDFHDETKTPPGPSAAHPVGEAIPTNHPVGEAIPAMAQEKVTEEAVEREELDLRDEEIANSVLENPALAEKLILDGDIEDDDEPSSDDDADE